MEGLRSLICLVKKGREDNGGEKSLQSRKRETLKHHRLKIIIDQLGGRSNQKEMSKCKELFEGGNTLKREPRRPEKPQKKSLVT